MKKTLAFLAITFTLSSCKDTWPQEYKEQYHSDCLARPSLESVPEEMKKRYCDCVLEKTIEKFPHVNDLLERGEELISDTSIQNCKELLQ